MTARRPPEFTIFPYTTLFRSARARAARDDGHALTAAQRHDRRDFGRSEEHTSELQSRLHLVCRLLLEKKNSQLQPLASCCPAVTLPSAVMTIVWRPPRFRVCV